MANDEEAVGIEIELDPIERAVLEMEARRRGVGISQVVTEMFNERMEAALTRAADAFFGPKRPRSGLN